jgi:hypothetical protein
MFIHAEPLLNPRKLPRRSQPGHVSNNNNNNNNNNSDTTNLASSHALPAQQVSPIRLAAAMPPMLRLLDDLASLPSATLNNLTSAHWCRVIMGIIALFRLSFPAPKGCSDWDPAVHAPNVDFGAVLEQLAHLGETADGGRKTSDDSSGPSREIDVVTASRLVMDSVLKKFREKRRRFEQQQQQQQGERERERERELARLAPSSPAQAAQWQYKAPGGELDASATPEPHLQDQSIVGCPMLNGSLKQFMEQWGGDAGQGGAVSMMAASPLASVGDVSSWSAVTPAGHAGPHQHQQHYQQPTPVDDVIGDADLEPLVEFSDPDIWATLTSTWPEQDERFWGGSGF